MYYVYILHSQLDKGFYTGFTTRIVKERVIEHQHGLVDSTKHRRPIRLVYYEAYPDKATARQREQKLKAFGSAYTGLLKRLGYK